MKNIYSEIDRIKNNISQVFTLLGMDDEPDKSSDKLVANATQHNAYCEFNGNQWFDIPTNTTPDIKWTVDFRAIWGLLPNGKEYSTIMGSRGYNSASDFHISMKYGRSEPQFLASVDSTIRTGIWDNEFNLKQLPLFTRMTISAIDKDITISNGIQSRTYTYNGDIVNSLEGLTMTIGALRDDGSYVEPFIGRIFSIRAENISTNKLVRDLIPQKDESGAGYFLDKITNQKFTSKTSTSLVYSVETYT